MRQILRFVGVVTTLVGLSGAVDHLWVQPVMGVLNVLNRFVFERVEFFAGWELAANLAVAALGGVVVAAARRSGT
ncbi:hypothetical protein LX16_2881 [Stackebrandtia albiflava]|uniref:Signal peptidase II n=1 Tax=Stackebrandtia albiflava TaxID=406432 RepID=A0A562V2N5_9ACTN|nr:hypothetical protein [Stackebrandtia albiflava]TWJ12131.1 hypothetical protein LX16_2881 [Stackebrandtia albiflava]